jgi:ABC-type multidrug transport system fused ATPase/permease subunit
VSRLLKYFKKYSVAAALGSGLKLFEVLLELVIPLVVARIIDVGIGNGDKAYCLKMIAIMAGLGLLGFTASVTAQYFSAKAAVGFAGDVRSAVFSHLQTLSFKDVDTLGTSTMITRITSDLNQVQTGVNMALRLLLRSPVVVLGAMIMAFTRDVQAAIIFVIVIPILAIVVFAIIGYTIPRYKQVQKKLDRVLGLTRENVNGVRVIRAFRNEEAEQTKFNLANEELKSLQQKVGSISALTNPFTTVIINFAIIFLIYTCGVRVNVGSIGVGTTVALYNYMSQILVELVKLANLIITITKSLACANRVADVLDIKPGMEDGRLSVVYETEADKPVVEFEHASISYHGNADEALTDVNLKVYPGETVGIIGGTGSGKTTLVSLIPRFYDVTEGVVRVFGNDVKELKLKELRDRIGIVMQKAVLFKGNVRTNLQFANEAAGEELMQNSLTLAQASGFLTEAGQTKANLDREISEGGGNVSGGQKQRISIARALVKKPDILILDDSASALDYATDAALRKAIKELNPKPVTFIVSQRTSSVAHADKIVVLDDGRVSGIGTHEELLSTNETYREIYNSQK